MHVVANCIFFIMGLSTSSLPDQNNLLFAWYYYRCWFSHQYKNVSRSGARGAGGGGAFCGFPACPLDCTGRLYWQTRHVTLPPTLMSLQPSERSLLHHMAYLALNWRHGGVGAQQAGRPLVGEKRSSRRWGSLLSSLMTSSNPVFRSLSLSLSSPSLFATPLKQLSASRILFRRLPLFFSFTYFDFQFSDYLFFLTFV